MMTMMTMMIVELVITTPRQAHIITTMINIKNPPFGGLFLFH